MRRLKEEVPGFREVPEHRYDVLPPSRPAREGLPGNAATTPANSLATLALPETVPTVPPYHCVSGVRKLAASPPLCSLTTSWRNASTTRSFALTDPAPPHDGAAAWVRCAGAAVVAFAVAPATPKPATARAAATAARCSLFMTISFVLCPGDLDLIVHVNTEGNYLTCQVISVLSSTTYPGNTAHYIAVQQARP